MHVLKLGERVVNAAAVGIAANISETQTLASAAQEGSAPNFGFFDDLSRETQAG